MKLTPPSEAPEDQAMARQFRGDRQTGAPPRRADRARSWMTALAGALAILAALLALDRVAGLGLFPPPLDLQLRAAALAVAPKREAEGGKPVAVKGPGGQVIPVPSSVHFDHAEAAALALRLGRKARRAQGAIDTARTAALYGDQGGEESLAKATKLWDEAREELAGFLALEPERAELAMAALGWPWMGREPTGLPTGELPRPFPSRPPGFFETREEKWEGLVALARKERPVQDMHRSLRAAGCTEEWRRRSFQAWMLRQAVRKAFHSPAGRRTARRELGRLGALASPQVEALLAMAGVKELLQAGPAAFPALIHMLRRRPGSARPLLKELVRASGIQMQALRAAGSLGGPAGPKAEKTLLRLGPFGRQALERLQDAADGRVGGERAGRALRVLSRRWPPGEDPFEVLGDDPELWRRWYEAASEVL